MKAAWHFSKSSNACNHNKKNRQARDLCEFGGSKDLSDINLRKLCIAKKNAAL